MLDSRDTAAPTAADVSGLLLLGLLWGGSFLFMRVGAPEFGAVTLVAVRVAVAAALLLPLLRGGAWRQLTPRVAWLGLFNSALPFGLFATAAQDLPASTTAVLNATAALWSAAIGWMFFGVAVSGHALAGTLCGLAGVVLIVGQGPGWPDARAQASAGVAAALAATICYAYSAHYLRAHLAHLPPRVLAAGSQLAAAVLLAVPGAVLWPEARPSLAAVASAVALGAFSTAWAYLIYFRLLERIGTARTMTVTVMVPVFGAALGVVVLGETLTAPALAGGALVLAGCTLALGGRRR